eukprot:PhF_6_TR42813/c0_g1_i1/m.64817
MLRVESLSENDCVLEPLPPGLYPKHIVELEPTTTANESVKLNEEELVTIQKPQNDVALRTWLIIRMLLVSALPLSVVISVFFVTFTQVTQRISSETRSELENDALQLLSLTTAMRAREFETQLEGVQRMNQQVAQTVVEGLDGDEAFRQSAVGHKRWSLMQFNFSQDGTLLQPTYDCPPPESVPRNKKSAGLSIGKAINATNFDDLRVLTTVAEPAIRAFQEFERGLLVASYLVVYTNVILIYPSSKDMCLGLEGMDTATELPMFMGDFPKNVQRVTHWTSVYIDLAGNGPMASCVTPIYHPKRPNEFIGIAGMDITVLRFSDIISRLQLAYSAYALLLDGDGSVIALSAHALEDNWCDIQTLTQNYSTYSDWINDPHGGYDATKVNVLDQYPSIGVPIRSNMNGTLHVELFGSVRTLTWDTIAGPEWKLIVIAKTAALYERAVRLDNDVQTTLDGIIAAMSIFAVITLAGTVIGSTLWARVVSSPLEVISNICRSIATGRYNHESPAAPVKEIRAAGDGVVAMGKELLKTHNAYARFLPAEAVATLQRKVIDLQLGHSIEKKMTVMFSDTRNFTTISESITMHEVFTLLNEVFNVMCPIVYKGGGFIEKFIGDCLMVHFPDDIPSAVKAGVRLQIAMQNTEFRSSGGIAVDIRIGVGIHHGGVMMGTVGYNNRMDVTTISDAVNTAARLESMTKTLGVQVLVSQSVATMCPTDWPMRCLGMVLLKGKKVGINVYEVFGAGDDVLPGVEMRIKNLDQFRRAVDLHRNGRFDEAAVLFRSMDPGDTPASFLQNVCLGPSRCAGYIEMDTK